MKKIVVANWKMNPVKSVQAQSMFRAILNKTKKFKTTQIVVCPPALYLKTLNDLLGRGKKGCALGAQNIHWESKGSYTGEMSADMAHDAGARYVLVGHSERRALGETDDMVHEKVGAAIHKAMTPIICVGEHERDQHMNYVRQVRAQLHSALEGLNKSQITRVVIAYEPVWAIGKNPDHACTPYECSEMVRVLRQMLADVLGSTVAAMNVPILYGGSVGSENVEEYFTEGLINGVLVGHESLSMKDFGKILTLVEAK